MNLLVITLDGFNDVELTGVLSCLSRSRKVNFTYYNPEKSHVLSQYGTYEINAKTDVNFSEFDAVFIPGGPAAIALRTNQKALNAIREFKNLNKDIYAICDAPNALYETGIIDPEESYSSFPMYQDPIELKLNTGKNRNDNLVTNSNNHLITGRCASAAIDLGLEIIKHNFGEELSEFVSYGMKAK
ncbi:DJ-1 family protein [Mycoplasma anatis]|uniref:DJ-1/PfpI family protein n=1 Tax=Mycoplasmopsis anatis TaxID=171279 RepID=UPI001C4DE2C9|nr:DJ-1/PfpI family protein [Mycoplasmopsis anatis]MBW0595720.1 DJ-1 family protein [Mycoplasmopsis anatis]MBW0597357.1 DJ-1 family protein [Mycoplasmopsis anatis]MBW0600522.1 DJ-1 family protein [Mycoplasmopsis anatis]